MDCDLKEIIEDVAIETIKLPDTPINEDANHEIDEKPESLPLDDFTRTSITPEPVEKKLKIDSDFMSESNLNNVQNSVVRDVDLKEKLKEMGEISLQSVKKGEKSKTPKSSDDEVTLTTTTSKKIDEDKKESSKGVHLRKNIREVMDETKLDKTTLAAQRQEVERLQRVQEQQRLLRELQRQATFDRVENKVLSLLQSNQVPKSVPTDQSCTRIGNTMVVKVSNAQNNCVQQTYPKYVKNVPMTPIKPPSYVRSVDLTPSVSIAVLQKDKTPLTTRTFESNKESQDHKGSCQEVPVIDISSDEDCIIVSESDEDNDEDSSGGRDDDPNNSGMHTNDQFNQPDSEGRVLINVGHSDTDPDVFIAPQVARIIKPHQIGGVRFLYDNVIESISRFESSTGFGCILAHSMGLGKTLQLVTFCDIFLRHTPARTVLIIMPINTLQNWLAEFNMWLPLGDKCDSVTTQLRTFNLFVLNESYRTLTARTKVVKQWATEGGVLLIGYEMFRLLSLKKNPKSRRKNPAPEVIECDKNVALFAEVHESLIKPGPDLVICDEGHRIKNSHASISQALKQIRTRRRIVLTGYPLQNNLMEYWCMVDFVRPSYLGTKTEFCNMFERPIMNGQCIDSTSTDRKLMRYRAHVLHSLLVGFVQRRSHAVLQLALPRKQEYVLLVKMLPFQRKLYSAFMEEVIRPQKINNPLKAFAVSCKIWNHPDVLYNFLKIRDTDAYIDLDLEEVANSTTNGNKTPGKGRGRSKLEGNKSNTESSDIIKIISDIQIPTTSPIEPINSSNENNQQNNPTLPQRYHVKVEDSVIPYDWAYDLLKDYKPYCIENSSKMLILFCIIKESIALGDRLLVFSQSLFTLDIIEYFLQTNHVPGQTENWCKNTSYYRLDGSTSALDREKLINDFNKNSKILLFLVSTRAGSLGINLIGANRVVVFDASWNPCHDTQAVCRVYRYGQQKPCFVYRLVVDNCLEKKIYDRQINKQGMSDRVVDECNPDAYLTLKDVATICWVERDNEDQQDSDWLQTKDNYTDTVLQIVIEQYGSRLNKEPFQHESLLIDRKEKQLSQQEKRLAKKSYEREKQATCRQTANSYFMPNNYSRFINTGQQYYNQQNYQRPVASVRPIQQPQQQTPIPNLQNRWIPAEQWQRQGMSAQEMTLPLDVVIPTNQADKSNIVLKAGQKVLILKSPKGVYMQLESGKIVAIKTAVKVKGKVDDAVFDPSLGIQQQQKPSIRNSTVFPKINPVSSSNSSSVSAPVPPTIPQKSHEIKPATISHPSQLATPNKSTNSITSLQNPTFLDTFEDDEDEEPNLAQNDVIASTEDSSTSSFTENNSTQLLQCNSENPISTQAIQSNHAYYSNFYNADYNNGSAVFDTQNYSNQQYSNVVPHHQSVYDNLNYQNQQYSGYPYQNYAIPPHHYHPPPPPPPQYNYAPHSYPDTYAPQSIPYSHQQPSSHNYPIASNPPPNQPYSNYTYGNMNASTSYYPTS